MYILICTHTYPHVHTLAHIHTHAGTHAHTYTNEQTHPHTRTNTPSHTHTHRSVTLGSPTRQATVSVSSATRQPCTTCPSPSASRTRTRCWRGALRRTYQRRADATEWACCHTAPWVSVVIVAGFCERVPFPCGSLGLFHQQLHVGE